MKKLTIKSLPLLLAIVLTCASIAIAGALKHTVLAAPDPGHGTVNSLGTVENYDPAAYINSETKNYQMLYLGTNPCENGSPQAWRVLNTEEGELFLLTEDMVKVIFDNNIDTEFYYGVWEERVWLNNDYHSNFSASELKAVRPQKVLPDYGNKSEYQGSDEETVYDPEGDLFFLLSQTEAQNPQYFPNYNEDLISGYSWFLRSPGPHDVGCIDFVFIDGYVCHDGYSNFLWDVGIRPACKLDLDSVLLMTPAYGGKPHDTGFFEQLQPPEQIDNIKLTLLDESLAPNFTAQAQALTKNTLTVQYSGANKGMDKSISAIITDKNDTVTHYGRMANDPFESGRFNMTLPNDFDQSTQQIKVFVEQHNGDYNTDYASKALVIDTNCNARQQIYFGANPFENGSPQIWRILNMGEGEMFLLSEGMVKVIFDNNIDTEFYYGAWEERDWLNSAYQSSFSANELKVVKPQKVLPDYGNKSEYQGSDEETVYDPAGDLFFLLCQTEALNPLYFPNYIDDLISAYSWFLRSPGPHDVGCIDFVFIDGYVCHDGYSNFLWDMGIRPACKLDLDSILLMSPVNGGKSHDIGFFEQMLPPEQMNNIKLTLPDESLAPNFAAQAQALSGNTLNVQYSGAVLEMDTSISAIIKDEHNTAIYYGKMAVGLQESGIFHITLPDDFDQAKHTIEVFVEQHNGDYKTDYASKPLLLSISTATPVYRKITPQEAYVMMNQITDYIILDVRTESEYKELRIPGAILIPDTEINSRATSELPDKNKIIFVYCQGGVRSERAARALVELGYTNIYDMGGINSWPYETIRD